MKLSISRSWIEPESCMQASSSSSFFSTRDFPFCSRPLTEKKEKKKKGENEQTRAGFSKKRKTRLFGSIITSSSFMACFHRCCCGVDCAACFYVLKPKFTWWKSDEEHGMSRSFFTLGTKVLSSIFLFWKCQETKRKRRGFSYYAYDSTTLHNP